jgi:hypothetical protein
MRRIVFCMTGLALGLLVVYIPYGFFALSVFALLTLFLVAKSFFKQPQPPEGSGGISDLLFCFWVLVVLFCFHPTGKKTLLPRMNVSAVRAGDLFNEWQKKNPNVMFDVSKVVADRKVSIRTITPISISEAVELVCEKAGASYNINEDYWSYSIARGPTTRVKVSSIESQSQQDDNRDLHDSDSYQDNLR